MASTTTEAKPRWQDLAAAKKKAVLDLIPPEWRIPEPVPSPSEQRNVIKYIEQFLTPDEIAITSSDAVDIVANTSSGKWTVVAVVTAFCHRAALAHQLTHCLHEIFFEQAIAEAAKLDEQFTRTKKPVGPLHGLPISFKDQFHVKGVETTMGYLGWIGTFEGLKGTGKERVHESELVREVRALGAIPFVKTSLPHTVMSMETWNHIVGYTLNPHNRLMSTGGSSGGEGALIAAKGSPLGIGTDIGGSIRIPSGFCGLYGIRPSFGRLPYQGAANSMPGQNTVTSVCGPLAPSARSLRLMLQSTLSQEPWLHDPAVTEIPWREELCKLTTKMAFGVYRTDPGDSPLAVRPLPPVNRAMEEVISVMRKLGHDVIEWTPPSHSRAMEIGLEAFTSDGGIDIYHAINLSGEPLSDRVKTFYGDSAKPGVSGDKIHATNVKLRQYQKEYLDYWNGTARMTSTGRPVDAVLCPVAPTPAFEIGKTASVLYTPFVNILDYTSVVIPVTKVDAAIDKAEANYTPLSDVDKAIRDEYDPSISEGTPIGFQFVGRRFQEEKMIAIAELFGDALAQTRD